MYVNFVVEEMSALYVKCRMCRKKRSLVLVEEVEVLGEVHLPAVLEEMR